MSYNRVIRADDPRAVEMLKENLEGFEGRQEYMQKVNDYYKANGTVVGCPGVDRETAVQLEDRVNEHQSTPYPGRFFKDNFAEINRLKSNIDRLENKPETMFMGWHFGGGEAVINLANNRLAKEFCEDKKVYEDTIDSLILIHDEALNQQLDILLVYDFNNISKDKMEIPFAASWFIENGIDIVSVKYDKRDFEKERRESLNNINCWRL